MVSPVSSPMTGGTSVTITGTNIANVASVTIGGKALVNPSPAVIAPEQLAGGCPYHAEGKLLTIVPGKTPVPAN